MPQGDGPSPAARFQPPGDHAARTERNHVARILAKPGVHSQLQAVLLALRYELIDQR